MGAESFLYFRVNITNFFKSMSHPLQQDFFTGTFFVGLLAFFNDVIWVKLVSLQSVFFAFLFFFFFFFFFLAKKKKKKKKKKKTKKTKKTKRQKRVQYRDVRAVSHSCDVFLSADR